MARAGEPRSVNFLRVGQAEFAVISVAMTPGAAPGNLTDAEASILSAILLGKSGRQIAGERRTSIRTVANQVAALYRKLQVTSRTELVQRLLQDALAANAARNLPTRQHT